MKVNGSSGDIAILFLNLRGKWRWLVTFTPRPLYPRERAPGPHWMWVWVDPRTGLDTFKQTKIFYPCWKSWLPSRQPSPRNSFEIYLRLKKTEEASRCPGWLLSPLNLLFSKRQWINPLHWRGRRVVLKTHFHLTPMVWTLYLHSPTRLQSELITGPTNELSRTEYFNRSWASQEITRILWNPEIHYPIHYSSPPASVQRQIKPVHVPHPMPPASVQRQIKPVHVPHPMPPASVQRQIKPVHVPHPTFQDTF